MENIDVMKPRRILHRFCHGKNLSQVFRRAIKMLGSKQSVRLIDARFHWFISCTATLARDACFSSFAALVFTPLSARSLRACSDMFRAVACPPKEPILLISTVSAARSRSVNCQLILRFLSPPYKQKGDQMIRISPNRLTAHLGPTSVSYSAANSGTIT